MQAKTFPVLYRIGQNGKVLQWSVSVEGREINVLSGEKGGKMTRTTSYATAKNVGRANETSAAEQALKEAESKWNKQKKKLYRESIDEAQNVPVLPMLALDYLKYGHRAKFPAIGQRKLNGMRGLRAPDNSEFRSRENNPIRKLPHIESQLRWLEMECPYWYEEIDGEIYRHGIPLGDIISLVKRAQPDSEKLEFHIFDLNLEGVRQDQRIDILRTIKSWMDKHAEEVRHFAPHIFISDSIIVRDEKHMIELQKEYESEGFEGIMLRDPNAVYVSGPAKTPAVFKRKSFQDAEFDIVDITEGAEGRAILHFVTKEGRPFSAELVGSDEVCREVFDNRTEILQAKKKATVKYQELSKYGVPTIGVKALVIRDYE